MTHPPKPKTKPRSARQLSHDPDSGHALSRVLVADDGQTPSSIAMAGFALIGAALAILVETLLT